MIADGAGNRSGSVRRVVVVIARSNTSFTEIFRRGTCHVYAADIEPPLLSSVTVMGPLFESVTLGL